MWLGELYGALDEIRTDLNDSNVGIAKEGLRKIMYRLQNEGLDVRATIDKGGD